MNRLILAILGLLSMSCTATAGEKFIILQSTTSTANSGLLDEILPVFKSETGIDVRVVAVGTGQALKNARNGDGDVLLVHARSDELAFVKNGFGVKRHDVMFNDFVVVGPASDPASVSGMSDVTGAMKKIAATKNLFASRGDNSGTHKKERSLWLLAGIDAPAASGTWYRETGSGMGATLNVAVGMAAYTLTDRATWIAFANKADFRIIVEGDKRLFNQYGVILVSPVKHPHIKQAEGDQFISWLISAKGQAAIAAFKRHGQQLFFPNSTR